MVKHLNNSSLWNCLSVFGHFVWLAIKGLKYEIKRSNLGCCSGTFIVDFEHVMARSEVSLFNFMCFLVLAEPRN